MTEDTIKRSTVALCCVCSAQMLEVADTGEIHTKGVRAAIITAHKLQAAMCLKAADIADEMLTVLQDVVMSAEINSELEDRIRAVIRKASAP